MADLALSGSSSDRPGNGGLGLAAVERLEDLDGIDADCARNAQKFDDVDAALAALVFRDEGLRLFQAFRQLMLGQLGALARLDHQLAKSDLLGGMDGFADAARASSHQRGRIIRSSDYPKKG